MIYILLSLAILYILAFLVGFWATLRNPWRLHLSRKTPVTIILCARNEEQNLPATLHAISQQNYPPELVEILLVDHHSSDNTHQLLSDFAACDLGHRKIIQIPDEYEGLMGKAAPWHAGMQAASNEIVLTTGADCVPPKDWIYRTIAHFDDRTQIVSGAALLVNHDKKDSLYARMQNLDMMLIQGMGFCLSALGFGGAGLSNNYALKKSAYFATGGFPEIGFSICEDVRLSQAIIKLYGPRSLKYHLDLDATPTTDPEPIHRLANMKSRWSMGTRRLGVGGVMMIAIAFFTHLLVPIFLFAGDVFVNETALEMLLACWFTNALFIASISNRMKRMTDLIALPLFLPYFWIYTSFLLIPVAFRLPIRWKGLWVREPK